jgi:hypothetical protein
MGFHELFRLLQILISLGRVLLELHRGQAQISTAYRRKDEASLFLYSPYGSNCIPVPLLLRVYFSPYMHNESWKQAHYWIRDTEKTLPSDIVSSVHPPSRYQRRARPQQVEVASAHHHGHWDTSPTWSLRAISVPHPRRKICRPRSPSGTVGCTLRRGRIEISRQFNQYNMVYTRLCVVSGLPNEHCFSWRVSECVLRQERISHHRTHLTQYWVWRSLDQAALPQWYCKPRHDTKNYVAARCLDDSLHNSSYVTRDSKDILI